MPLHIRVFLASPFDVVSERQTVFEAAARLPYDPLLRGRITCEVVAWDGPYGGIPLLAGVDPQTAVGMGLPLPSECDIVIVILHGRLGSLLPEKFAVDGRSVTGTEWEYEDAMRAFRERGRPEVLVYRNTAPVTFDLASGDPTAAKEQVEGVKAFCERIQSEKRGINSFGGDQSFGEILSLHLKAIIARLLNLPDARATLLRWLSEDGTTPPMDAVLAFAANDLEEPHLRVMVADRLADLADSDHEGVARLARSLMAVPSEVLGKAGIKLAKRSIERGVMEIAELAIAAANPKWEVKSAAVAVTANFDSLEVLTVYESIGKSLSYWRPVQTLSEHLVRLADRFDPGERERAVAVLEKLLSNPRQSEKQQAGLETAIRRVRVSRP
jgi:hypothetical protein